MCDHNAGAVSFRRSHSGTAVVLLATNPCVTRCNCVDDSWHMHMSLQRFGARRLRMAQGPAISRSGFARHHSAPPRLGPWPCQVSLHRADRPVHSVSVPGVGRAPGHGAGMGMQPLLRRQRRGVDVVPEVHEAS